MRRINREVGKVKLMEELKEVMRQIDEERGVQVFFTESEQEREEY